MILIEGSNQKQRKWHPEYYKWILIIALDFILKLETRILLKVKSKNSKLSLRNILNFQEGSTTSELYINPR